MKKIVLTSCGIIAKELREEFSKLFNIPVSELKVLYIPVAVDGDIDDDKEWALEEFQTILDLGIKKENIKEYRMDYELDLNDYDFIYMMGGNTFYLMSKIRQYKFDIKIKQAIENGVVYVGSSAGSEILGTTIEVALPYDENICDLKDYTGLKIVDAVIIPHANRKTDFIMRQKLKYKEEVYQLFDEHAIIIVDDVIKPV